MHFCFIVCDAGFQFIPEAGYCYLLLIEAVNWTTATQRCNEDYNGSYLVVINSMAEQIAMEYYLSDRFTCEYRYWIECSLLVNLQMTRLSSVTGVCFLLIIYMHKY